jgi:hypothetical protein
VRRVIGGVLVPPVPILCISFFQSRGSALISSYRFVIFFVHWWRIFGTCVVERRTRDAVEFSRRGRIYRAETASRGVAAVRTSIPDSLGLCKVTVILIFCLTLAMERYFSCFPALIQSEYNRMIRNAGKFFRKFLFRTGSGCRSAPWAGIFQNMYLKQQIEVFSNIRTRAILYNSKIGLIANQSAESPEMVVTNWLRLLTTVTSRFRIQSSGSAIN